MYKYARTHNFTHTLTQTHTHIDMYKYARTHIFTHTHTHTLIQTRMHACTHTGVCIVQWGPALPAN
jgi:carbohydrate-binding DOMON domain-containing protein